MLKSPLSQDSGLFAGRAVDDPARFDRLAQPSRKTAAHKKTAIGEADGCF
jgi:hypothetical protein